MTKKNEKIAGGEVLSPQEEAFCRYYADPESESFGNAAASTKRAGYAEAYSRTSAWKLLRRYKVKMRIQQIYSESVWTPEKVMTQIAANRRKADEKGDLSTVARCDELLAKRLGLLTERLIRTEELPDRKIELDAAQRRMAGEMALLWSQQVCGLLPAGSGFTVQNTQSQPTAEPAEEDQAQKEDEDTGQQPVTEQFAGYEIDDGAPAEDERAVA